jgi:hypothetical protein
LKGEPVTKSGLSKAKNLKKWPKPFLI